MTAGASEFGVDQIGAGDVDAFVGERAVKAGGGELGQHGLVVDVAVAGGDEDGRAAGADVVFHDELAAEGGHVGDVLDGVQALVVVDVAGVVADADGWRLEAVVQFAQGGAVLADAGVGLGQQQDAGVFGGADAGFEGGVEAVDLGLPGRAALGVVGEAVGAVFVGTPADEGGHAGFGGEFDGLEEVFGFAGVRGDAAVGLVVDLESGVEDRLDGGSSRRGVGAFGPDRTFVVPVVEADVGEAGSVDAGVGAAAGKAVAGVGDGEGGEAVRHGSVKLPDGDWGNRAVVGWAVNRDWGVSNFRAARFVGYSRPPAGNPLGVFPAGGRELGRIFWDGLRADGGWATGVRSGAKGGSTKRRREDLDGGNLGVSRAVRVFSKKLLRRLGVHFGGVWDASGIGVESRLRGFGGFSGVVRWGGSWLGLGRGGCWGMWFGRVPLRHAQGRLFDKLRAGLQRARDRITTNDGRPVRAGAVGSVCGGRGSRLELGRARGVRSGGSARGMARAADAGVGAGWPGADEVGGARLGGGEMPADGVCRIGGEGLAAGWTEGAGEGLRIGVA